MFELLLSVIDRFVKPCSVEVDFLAQSAITSFVILLQLFSVMLRAFSAWKTFQQYLSVFWDFSLYTSAVMLGNSYSVPVSVYVASVNQ